MSDHPTESEHDQAEKLHQELRSLISRISLFTSGRDFPDMRHAVMKMESASRGFDDFHKRPTTIPAPY